MAHDLSTSIIRILNQKGETLGAGFVVSDRLAVTCAHVIQQAGGAGGLSLSVARFQNTQIHTAEILTTGWSDPETEDLAFLALPEELNDLQPVTAGTAKGREGHLFTTLGFPESGRYDAGAAGGNLSAVLPIRGGFELLHLLRGDEIDRGMSGAPVLDLDSDRVVGMVTEYKDKEYTRSGFATPMDVIVRAAQQRLPALRLWPDEYGPQELERYLADLVEANGSLKLPDGRDVPLERIYVSLRADEMNAAERQAEKDFFDEEYAADLNEMAGAASSKDPYLTFAAIRRAIARRPKMQMLTSRDWERQFGEHTHGSLSLAEVVQRHHQVVLLGDPGSGKTTLGKWLTLQFARATQEGRERVEVQADLVSPDGEAADRVDLGTARLPVFIRIADYAQARFGDHGDDSEISLEQFIAQGNLDIRALPEGLNARAVGAMARDHLAAGTALVILDGLDEVHDPGQRQKVMNAVDAFIRPRIGGGSVTTKPSPAVRISSPIVLTSRIIGYQFQPLTHLPHYTVEDMDETAIAAFCRAWMLNEAAMDAQESEADDAEAQAQGLKDAIFDHAHPGVRELAGNPLLLTILAQVYKSNRNRALPSLRVDLFEEAEKAFYDQRERYWEQSGITRLRLGRALGAVAAYIHAEEATGFVDKEMVRACLFGVLPDRDQVDAVLDAADRISGFLVSRGEGVYAFIHRALQEYFVAKYLVDDPGQVVERLAKHALDPTWREPLVLAMGLIREQRHAANDRNTLAEKVFAAWLAIPDPAGEYMPRSEMLAAAACVERERIPKGLGQGIASRLLDWYADREGRGKSPAIRKGIDKAFANLYRSPARKESDAVLLTALLDPDFERRYAAAGLLRGGKWDTPAVARALVRAYHDYPGPAGSLLSALEGMGERHPEFFTADFLPFRAAMEADPDIWKMVIESKEWSALVAACYLPEGGSMATENIRRDSPLTTLLLEALWNAQGADVSLGDLPERLRELAKLPGSAAAAEAALALAALGDDSWIAGAVSAAGESGEALFPAFARLMFMTKTPKMQFRVGFSRNESSLASTSPRAFARALGLELDRPVELATALGLALDHAVERARNNCKSNACALDLGLAPILHIARYLALSRAIARSLALNRDLDIDLELDIELVSAQKIANEIGSNIQLAQERWAGDKDILAKLNTAKSVLKTLHSTEGLLPSLQEVLISFSLATSARYSPPVPPSEQRAGDILTLEMLPTLTADLRSPDDGRRRAARNLLMRERPASSLGQECIEGIAALALSHRREPEVGTQMEWALSRIEHDRVDWFREWIQAARDGEDAPAENILHSIHKVIPEVSNALNSILPHSSPRVNRAILDSLGWLVRLEQIPNEDLAPTQERLIAWLEGETNVEMRAGIVEVLGHWRQDQVVLFDRLLPSLSTAGEAEAQALCAALARLASRKPALWSQVQEALVRELPRPSAAAGLARLAAVEPERKVEDIVNHLAEHLAEPVALLTALVDAGIDNDIWEDDFHGALVNAVRLHVENHAEDAQGLLASLTNLLRDALAGDPWPPRRMALAAVTACAEAMPKALQRICPNLEDLLVRGAADAESHNTRRFAITALSYLHTVTPAVVPALLVACRDIGIVQQDAIKAARRFQFVKGDLLPELAAALAGRSASTAYTVAQLLGALGASAAGGAAGLRDRILATLVEVLKNPECSQQEVFVDESKYGKPVSKGKLEETLYAELLRVAGWPS